MPVIGARSSLIPLLMPAIAVIVGASIVSLLSPAPVAFDLKLYRTWAEGVLTGGLPYPFVGVAYPPIALAPIVVAGALRAVTTIPYEAAFTALTLPAALEVGRQVRASGVVTRRPVLIRYSVVVAVLGPLVLWRIDIFIVLLVAVAFVATIGCRPWLGGIVLGLAIGAKLYPAALVLPFAAYLWAAASPQAARRFISGTTLTTIVALAPTVIAGGGTPIFVTFFADRGLHLESVYGGILALAGATHAIPVHLTLTHYAWELQSTMTPLALVVATGTTAVSVSAATIVAAARAAAAGRDARIVELAGASLLVLLTLIVTSKVLSPQYLLWLTPFAAVMQRRWFAAFLVVCVLTTLTWPILSPQVIALEVAPVVVLNLRNALLVTLLIWMVLARKQAMGLTEDLHVGAESHSGTSNRLGRPDSLPSVRPEIPQKKARSRAAREA